MIKNLTKINTPLRISFTKIENRIDEALKNNLVDLKKNRNLFYAFKQ